MSVTENGIDFNSFEREIFRGCCAAGREAIKIQLKSWDNELMLNRDRSVYRHKGQRKTVLKTVMGEVEYERAVYERINEDGTKSYVYLLDEAMDLPSSGKMSGLLSGLIAEAVCEGTYRHAAKSVSEMTGQTLSHMAAWTVTQQLGKRIDAQEQVASEAAAKSKGCGKLETPVLFEEQDGIVLNLQGKSRKKHGKNKEMKVAIAYDGAEKVGKNRYKLTNKVSAANFESAVDFIKRKEGKIAQTYNVDEIEARILNGDGASWIKRSVTDETVHFQLDTFHRNKAVLENVSHPEMRKHIFKLLYTKQTDLLLDHLEALANSVSDDREYEKMQTLLNYFTTNKDGLIGWHRRGLGLPDAPKGKEYRRLGAMESNIFTIIGNRMKGGRACWSVEGGNNLARLLTLKHTGRLRQAVDSLTTWTLPERYAQEVTVSMSSAKAPKADGKGFEPRRGGAAPATPEYRFLREIYKAGELTV